MLRPRRRARHQQSSAALNGRSPAQDHVPSTGQTRNDLPQCQRRHSNRYSALHVHILLDWPKFRTVYLVHFEPRAKTFKREKNLVHVSTLFYDT